MNYTTYSFEDVNIAFSCNSVGAASSKGAGLGSIAIAMANERTAHEVAADGSVMVSKIIANNGTIAIAMQQTSKLHKYLLAWYNYINSPDAPLTDWTNMNISIRSNAMGELTNCTGVSPQKLPDKPYQAQGQQITWTLMVAEITQANI
jgi:hypothetical protein